MVAHDDFDLGWSKEKSMTKSTKVRIAIYALAVLVAGLVMYPFLPHLPLDDATLRKMVVGSWVIDVHRAGGISVTGECSFRSNGTYSSRQRIIGTGEPQELAMDGTWKIQDGMLFETTTNTSAPSLRPLDSEVGSRVVDVSKKEIVFESSGDGTRVSLRRRGR
jgi:hypothetical protein